MSIIIIKIALWALFGLWSFVLTQNHIKGWEYIKKQRFPSLYFGSAMILGPITTLFCIYTLIMYNYKNKEVKNEKVL